MELFFLDGGCFKKVNGAKMEVVVVEMEVVVVEMVVSVIVRVVWANLGVLLEVVGVADGLWMSLGDGGGGNKGGANVGIGRVT